MTSNGFYIAAILIGCLFNISTILIEKKTKKRFIKYIPSILACMAALAFYIKAFYFSEGFGEIGYFLIFIILAAVTVASLVTAIVLDITKKKRVN